MVNKNKSKGTAAESAIVAYLRDVRGWKRVERRTLAGVADKGDIAGLATDNLDAVVEVKSCARLEFSKWLAEAEVEKKNAKADVGVVWAKKRGKSDPGEWYVVMTGKQFVDLFDLASKLKKRAPK